MLTITGYSDRISVRPGETINFMVNCEHPTYQADIVRLICADDTPAGPGFKERPVHTPVSKRRKGRRQVIHAGSYALVESRPLLETLGSFTVQAMIWPTTPGKGEQGIVTKWDSRSKTGFALVIDDAGSVALRLGVADGTVETVSVGKPLLERHWYLAAASYDAESGRVTVYQEPLLPYARVDDGGTKTRKVGAASASNRRAHRLGRHLQAAPEGPCTGGRPLQRQDRFAPAGRPRAGSTGDRAHEERGDSGRPRARHPLRLGFLARHHLRSGFLTAPPTIATARSSTCPRAA